MHIPSYVTKKHIKAGYIQASTPENWLYAYVNNKGADQPVHLNCADQPHCSSLLTIIKTLAS